MPEQRIAPDIRQLLDAALELPAEKRDAYLAASGAPAEQLARLRRLLALADAPGFLDRRSAPVTRPTTTDDDAPGIGLGAGRRIGPYALVKRLGRGGMGEVWLADRVEGGFAQRVAIKCQLTDGPAARARFDAEREILAGLAHPGIARLHDGGIVDDAIGYMVMEYVEGDDLLAWCERHALPLGERLRLFLEVCDAVAHAHTHLVVHRDIKPANILVDASGRTRLVDFGIARPLGDGDPAQTAHMSPAYAAPEQFGGGAVTTATDVHALGATLFQLLAGRLPWEIDGRPLGQVLLRLQAPPPEPASHCMRPGHPVQARQLRGDLDAIVAHALRPEPALRYPDARAMAEDLRRHLARRPVHARRDAFGYAARRFLRRNWLPVGAAAALFAALAAGTLGIAWQARLAQGQAERATAVKEHLLEMFAASDPRIASDAPRGAVSARALLDASVARIDRDFATRPELRIELLGVTAGIYRELGEQDRYRDLHRRQMALVEQHHGPLHPLAIEGLLRESDDAVLQHDYPRALALVELAGERIARTRLQGSALHAAWWLRQAAALEADAARGDERLNALEQAVSLYARIAPDDHDHVVALGNLAATYWELDTPGSQARARDFAERAVATAEALPRRNDGELQVLLANLGQIETALGNVADADAAFERASALAQRTYGEDDRRYWNTVASWAGALHARGDRVRALALFEHVAARLPETPDTEDQDAAALVLARYGAALVREGQAIEGLRRLLRAQQGYERAQRGQRLPFVHRMLAEAYEEVGRPDDAARQYALLAEALANEAPDSGARVAARERHARFLLSQGDDATAEAWLREIVGEATEATAAVAMAHAGLARIAIGRGEAAAALQASDRALAVLQRLDNGHDARLAPTLWLVRAQALAAAGDADGARSSAGAALGAFRRYDHPQSPRLREAGTLLATLPARE